MFAVSRNDSAASLAKDLRRGGYFPDLIASVLDLAIAGESVVAHLLQPETTFDQAGIRRHLTAAVLTPSRLIVAHVDDHLVDDVPTAMASTEAVPLGEIRSVVVTHGVSNPEDVGQMRRRDLTIALGWGAVQRLDLEPAGCSDPQCEADHGFTGSATSDDLVLRVSADAEGESALLSALAFARALSGATARS
ncbi:hypothetical protein EDD28_3097 [Salana multivorans]|uniref:Phosphodiesterase n=1 Tax=Salana multivorans TaxID=120377 RepID=A0A3N2D1M1_9MICO|nr:DUF5998 family protein [Salana multivorans]MBN8882491.1 phosphodiesterase [Salana multivorans]OJX94448.1 MAG: phosphodiesterase [Micrococcales bacterium 73-15]ROR93675.1 hypothetical protein EDD28_3097 [Salana multivorans]